MVTVNLRTKSPKTKIKSMPPTLDVDVSGTVEDVANAISKLTKLDRNRLRLTLIDNTLLVPESSLDKYDLQDSSIIYVKDLGYQINWRTVFFIEYFGPLAIHPLFFFCQKLIYGKAFAHNETQTILFYMIIAHFLKRELETAFVHRFSNATMPFFNIFKNSGHYWILSGFNLAYWLYAPDSRPQLPNVVIRGLVLLWVYAEFSNLVTHLNLASLRPAGTKDRKIPFGYGFDLVSFPNYLFESIGWLIFSILGQSLAGLLFWAVSSGTMYIWAIKKHKKYRKEFGDKYPKNRKAMIPFVA
ncbi:3-oxo-5-alpha-steroid 4-dehydrogenase-domain-containing protein [Dipodascopsis uninucleata]